MIVKRGSTLRHLATTRRQGDSMSGAWSAGGGSNSGQRAGSDLGDAADGEFGELLAEAESA